MTVIVRVSPSERVSLAQLVRMPLGLDVWEVSPDSVVLRAAESVLERMERMGYTVEQLDTTERHLAAFASEEALAGYHSAAALEQDLRHLVEQEPELAKLREIGRSVEDRPIWALRIGEPAGLHGQATLPRLPPRPGVDLSRGRLSARRAPRRLGERRTDSGLAAARGAVGGADGQP